MALVVQMIQELGVEVKHIPGGCTHLCQPADVGFNKPFKNQMQKQWLNLIIAKDIIHGTTSPPSRVDMVKWVDAAMMEMKGEGEIIQNTWKRHGSLMTQGNKLWVGTTRGTMGVFNSYINSIKYLIIIIFS